MRKAVSHKSRSESSRSGSSGGRTIRTRPISPEERPKDIAPAATLRAAALRKSLCGEPHSSRFPHSGGRLPSGSIERDDLRLRVRRETISALILIVLDVSDSMGAQQRIDDAKAGVLGLLKIAHRMRYRVGLITISGKEARGDVPPTSSVQVARKGLAHLRPSGGTPLASGLRLAVRTIRNEELKYPGIRPVLLILSDGEATVPFGRSADPHIELIRIAERIRRRERIQAVCVDTKERPLISTGENEMLALSRALGADYYHRDELTRGTRGGII